jgi:drug/metabolite transporter (DMT)-like permease
MAQLEVVLAAMAFALSVPANKLLLSGATPLALSSVLYLAAGSFSAILIVLSKRGHESQRTTNAIQGAEWGWLAGAVVSGAVVAPMLLFVGLRQVSGHAAGLLLNFEAVFTVALGILLSGEHLGRRGWLGAAVIVSGAVLLSLPSEAASAAPTRWPGIVLLVSACLLWGLDNNLTQRISLRDARQIVAVKGLAGGVSSLLLATMFGGFGHWTATRLLIAACVGMTSFGLSIVLFVRGLRQLGVLQTGMLFALAPGFAAVLSWSFLREPLALAGGLALVAMTSGALLLASDRHEHEHVHEQMEHSHAHEHDEHHQHDHTPEQLAQVPHAHPHRHEPLVHIHAHVHDVHHRHRH